MASTDALPVPRKNVAYRVTFPLLDADGDLVTGATGLDSEISKDAGTFADCTNEATEIATSSGMYYLDLTSTEMNADCVALIIKTSSSGAKTTPIVLYPQEADDIRVNATYWVGGAIPTPTNTGVPNVNAKTWNDLATVALPLVPTTAGRTLDVSAGGEAGVDWANVGSPTTSLALTGTTIATTQKVDVETIKTNPVVNAGTVTFPTTATLASTTNITAGTITTVTTTATATNVTTVNGLAAGVITAASIAADAITDAKVASDVTIASVTGAVGSVTGNVGGNVTGSVGSIATGGISAASFAAGAIDAAAIATDAIGSAEISAAAVTKIQAGLSTLTQTQVSGGAYALNSASFAFNAAMDFTTTQKAATLARVTLTDTVTTYTGDTPQTGDSYAIVNSGTHGNAAIKGYVDDIGVAGAGLTALASAANLATANAALAKLDDTVEDNAGTYRFTTAALVNAPSSGSAPTAVQIRQEMDSNSTQLAAIVADTNELQTDWANGGRLDLILDARSSQASVDDLPTNAELATALGTADDATLAAIAALNNLSAAQVNAEVDTALADYDAPTNAEMVARTLAAASYATAANQTAMQGATFDTATDSLEAIRNRGDAAWVTATGFSTHSAADVVAAIGTGSTLTALATAANLATANTALAKLDDTVEDNAGTYRFTSASLVNAPSSGSAPTAVQIRQEMDSNSTQLAAIVADTNELQTDWVNGGRLDLILDATATQTSVNTIDDLLDTEMPALMAAVAAIPTAAANAAALMDLSNGIETSITPRQAIRLILAAAAGKLSGAATTTIAIRNVGDSKDRITATVDSNGNRSAVTVDAT